MTEHILSSQGTKSFSGYLAMTLMAFIVAFGATNIAAPDQAEAGARTKIAKKTLKFVGKGAAKFERKMRGKGKFGRALGRTVGKVGRGAVKLRRGISKVQGGVKRVVGKVCRGPCGKALATGRKVKRKFNRFKRKIGGGIKRGFKKIVRPGKHRGSGRNKFRAAGRLNRAVRHRIASGARKPFRNRVDMKRIRRVSTHRQPRFGNHRRYAPRRTSKFANR
jgi:hypothetical protein